jgi:hypothetical protein
MGGNKYEYEQKKRRRRDGGRDGGQTFGKGGRQRHECITSRIVSSEIVSNDTI